MKTKNSHQQTGGARATAGTENRNHAVAIKIGLDIHAQRYVVVVQHDHATPKPARRFAPGEFVPWAAGLRARGHRVCIVYEACGFGFGLCRELRALGAQCHVIAPFKLDESGKRVKTDALDASTLCQRLSRFVEGNLKELPGSCPSFACRARRRNAGGTSLASAKGPGAGADQNAGPGPRTAHQSRPGCSAALVAGAGVECFGKERARVAHGKTRNLAAAARRPTPGRLLRLSLR